MKRLLLLLLTAALLTACQQGGPAIGSRHKKADALLDSLTHMDAEEGLLVVDSLMAEGILGDAVGNSIKGEFYFDMGQLRTSEYYYRKAMAEDRLLRENPGRYYRACVDMGTLLSNKGDQEGSLAIVLKGYQAARNDTAIDSRRSAARLLGHIGNCQLWLRRTGEAEQTYNTAYNMVRGMVAEDPSIENLDMMAGMLNNLVIEHNNSRQFQLVQSWLDRLRESVALLTAHPDCRPERADEMKARLAVNQAIVWAETGRKADAAKAYREFLGYDYAESDNGLLDKAVYLEAAELWHEAARLQQRLDSLDKATGVPLSMDYLSSNLGSMFITQLKSGEKDDALRTAERIVDLLDSVNTILQRSDAAEMATVYQTQEKEQKIAEQQQSISRQRNIGLASALALLTVFFMVYTYHRRQAHRKLQAAYDQLEETTTAKERIESELRIARSIQMSMVPSQMPDIPGLDLYASMAPAKEVGGDLYDYLLTADGHRLYFCLGDVSGKGVPASLFMAQTLRLLRSLAKQDMTPADIANHLNDELTEGNENGMFVTLFIGLLNLDNGHLSFCNCGHNPPVIGDGQGHFAFLDVEPNAPIGLFPGIQYEGEETEACGRPLLLYTDGLNEAENAAQEQFGDERLISILQQSGYGGARSVVETLTAEVERHRNGAEPNDDLTMLSLRFTHEKALLR